MAACCEGIRAGGEAGTGAAGAPVGGGVGDWVRLVVGVVLAGLSMQVSLGINLGESDAPTRAVVHGVLAVVAVGVFCLLGRPLWETALAATRRGQVTLEALFLVAIAGAYGASLVHTFEGTGAVYYEVVAVLVCVHAFGRLMVGGQRRRAVESVRALSAGLRRAVRVTCCGKREEIALADVRSGDRIAVEPGERIPVDGVVRAGRAYVQELAHTGEPFPAVRGIGDMVVAGSRALDGGLEVTASHDGAGREIDRMAARLEDALAGTARWQREADRWMAWFVPGVLCVAAGTFWFWLARDGWGPAWFHALAVLLVACPCGLGIGIPMAIWAGLHRLARLGVVPLTPDAVERLGLVTRVVFDKTGTLTENEMELSGFEVRDGFEADWLKGLVGAIQGRSDHPVARPFGTWLGCLGGADVVGPVKVLAGRGVRAVVATEAGRWEVTLGNVLLVEGEEIAQLAELRASASDGDSGRELVVMVDGRLAGLAVLAERIRSGVGGVVGEFQAMGIRADVMTGDAGTAAVVGEGFGAVARGMTPEEKALAVAELEAGGGRVLFVGDGLNDAEAMARSTAAVVVSGGDATARAAAVAEVGPGELPNLAAAVGVARQVRRRVRQIVGFALVYNLVGIAVAAAGWLHPVFAAVIMFGSSATVLGLALRGMEGALGRRPVVSGL